MSGAQRTTPGLSHLTSRSSRSRRSNMAAASRPVGVPASRSAPARTSSRTTSSSPLNRAPATGVWLRLLREVQVGASLDQHPHRLGVAVVRREHQRGVAVVVPDVDRQAVLDEPRPAHRSCPHGRSAWKARSPGRSPRDSCRSCRPRSVHSRWSPGSPLSHPVVLVEAEVGGVRERVHDLVGHQDLAPSAIAATRAAIATLRPKKSPSRSIAVPVCRPIRTRSGVRRSWRLRCLLAASARWMPRAGLECQLGRREDHHVAVALALHDVALVPVHIGAQEPVVGPEQLHPVSSPSSLFSPVEFSMSENRIGHGAVSGGDPGDLVALLHRPRGEVVDRARAACRARRAPAPWWPCRRRSSSRPRRLAGSVRRRAARPAPRRARPGARAPGPVPGRVAWRAHPIAAIATASSTPRRIAITARAGTRQQCHRLAHALVPLQVALDSENLF